MTIVSYSEVFKWQTCPRQYYYSYILDRRPITSPDAMDTGTKGHLLLQKFYELMQEGKTKEEAWELVKVMAQKVLAESGLDYNMVLAWTLVDNYIRDTSFKAEAILVENRFLVPFSVIDPDPAYSHAQIGFTPDVGLLRTGNWLDVEDYKFIQRAWPQAKIDRFPQLKIYQLLLESMGYNVSRTVLRFFNVKTGKITVKNYEMGEKEAATLRRDFAYGVKSVVDYKVGKLGLFNETPRTMNYTACQWCAFTYPCGLEAEGKDASNTLATQYKKSDYDYNK